MIWKTTILVALLGIHAGAYPSHASGATIRAVYPRLQPGQRLTLRAGPPIGWNRPIAGRAIGGAVEFVRPVALGSAGIEFKILLDDQRWSTGRNFKLQAGRPALEVHPFFGPARGRVVIAPGFQCPGLKPRSLRIYLPGSYEENPAKRYPVLYMHDGQNLYDGRDAPFGKAWEVGAAMDAGVERGEVPELLVVGIDNTQDRMLEYVPSPTGELYGSCLLGPLKAYVDSRLRTLPGRDSTFMMGSSLGGLFSVYWGLLRHPETYSRVASLSGSFWWNSEETAARIRNHNLPGGTKPPGFVIYLDSGDSGPSQDGMAETGRVAGALASSLGFVQGTDMIYRVYPGAQHNEWFWAARLPAVLRDLTQGL